jgi:hypothetical protein|tara:strand:+ start:203 stop:562 length:360 start_codon:yes stop_codon:yes gene_type:complete
MHVKPIYVNIQHEILIESFLDNITDNLRDLTDIHKYKDFIDMSSWIIEYHNMYSNNKNAGNWDDFLMIIPINLSCMVNGFLLGIENKDNRGEIRIYREIIGQYSTKLINDLQKIRPIDD